MATAKKYIPAWDEDTGSGITSHPASYIDVELPSNIPQYKPNPDIDASAADWMRQSPQFAELYNLAKSGGRIKRIPITDAEGNVNQNGQTKPALVDLFGDAKYGAEEVPGYPNIVKVKTYNATAGGFLDTYLGFDPATGYTYPIQNIGQQVRYQAPTSGTFFSQLSDSIKQFAPLAAVVFGGPLAAELGGGLLGAAGSSAAFQVAAGTPVDKIAENVAKSAATSGIVGSSGLDIGNTVTDATGSTLAGQVAQGTTAGLLTGKNPEQAVTGAVQGVALDSLRPDIGVTVPTEQQSLAGQQDLMNQLAPYEAVTTPAQPPAQPVIDLSTVIATPPTQPPVTIEPPAVVQPPVSVEPIVVSQEELKGTVSPFETTAPVDTTASAFDTTTDISDTSGFYIPTPTPQTPINGNTGGNMATYDEEMNAPATELQDTTPFNYTPEEQQIIYQLAQEAGGTQNISDAYAALTQAAQQTANQSGLTVGNVLKFFQSNPNLTKGLVTAGVSAAGGLLTNQANVQAAQISAQAMRDAAATAAEAQKFRPVGVTTRFGASQFGFDPTTGQLTSAGYTVNPELKAMQDRIMALSGQGLTEAEQAAGRYAPLTAGAQGLFGLGQQYLAQSPEQVAADYMAKQQNLLAPGRERQFAQLQNQLFNTGRGGLSVGATGARPSGAAGLGAASPEMEAYYNALAQQDAALAAQATQAGQQQVQFGAGLLGSGANLLGSYTQGLTGAYSPFSTGIGVGSSLESLGQAPLDIGAQLGGRSAQAGANVGQTLLQGGLLGARTTQAASGVSPFGTVLTGLANSPEAQQALAQWLNSGAGYGTNTRQLDTNTNF